MWNFTKGYVIIRIEEVSVERFIGLALKAGLRLWDVRRTGPRSAQLTLRLSDYKKLVGIRRKSGGRIIVTDRRGAYFILLLLWKRKLLLLGSILGLAALLFLSGRLWFIEISGNRQMGSGEVLALLAENGIERGKRGDNFDFAQLGHKLSSSDTRLAWIGFELHGVVLSCKVVEAEPRNTDETGAAFCDIVAEKGGVITRVEVTRGKSAVTVGQSVLPGDILITGHVVHSPDTTAYDTRASGEVYAAVEYSVKLEAPSARKQEGRSGESHGYLRIEFLGRRLYESECRYELFEYERGERKRIELLLPLVFTTGRCYELEEYSVELSPEERQTYVQLLARRQALEIIPDTARVLAINCTSFEQDGVLYGSCTVLCEESIGVIREYGA